MAAKKGQKKIKVTFPPKQAWQKPDCLFCDQPATLEATAKLDTASANVRCCVAQTCKRKAAQNARAFIRAFSK